MVAYRHRREVLSKETVSLGEQMSLGLQSQPKEPQLTCDPAQEPHCIGKTGEGQDLSGVEYIPPGQVQTNKKPELGNQGVRGRFTSNVQCFRVPSVLVFVPILCMQSSPGYHPGSSLVCWHMVH